MKNLKVYLVFREYCSPARVTVLAKSKKQAKELTCKKYGGAIMKVKLCDKEGIIMDSGIAYGGVI